MFEPVKVGLGDFLQGFYAELVATTPALKEFKQRGFPYCFAFAPSRMVDQANDMLATWQKNDTTGKSTTPAKLPAVIVAVAKDYTPTGRDFSYQVADPIEVTIPNDPLNRYFEIKTVVGDIRVQLAICASDEASAKSIAAQLLLYVDSPSRRGFDAKYTFAKNDVYFPCQIESPDSPASSIETGNHNITMLTIDFNLHCTVPIYSAPLEGDPNDGSTAQDNEGNPLPYDPANPSGYPLVQEINQTDRTEGEKENPQVVITEQGVSRD